MTEREALLAAILAQPDEDLPRLMYADEIEEAEPARAEFIRVQCELARLIGNVDDAEWKCLTPKLIRMHRKTPITQACGECRVCALNARQKELWEFVACAGVPIGIGSNQITLERGFVKKVECSAQAWLAHADQSLAAHPVQDVTLTTMPAIRHTIDTINTPNRHNIVVIRCNAMWGAEVRSWSKMVCCQGSYKRDELARSGPVVAQQAMQEALRATDPITFCKTAWPTVKTWHLQPQDRLGEMFRYVAGDFAAMGGQPPEVSNGDRIMADLLAWRMANNPGT